MLSSVPIAIVVGSLLGFLAGIGVGGGSLLILWLTIVLNIPQDQARIINLLFFLPSAMIACLFRWKQGKLDLKKTIPAIIGGCVTAILFSLIGQKLDTTFLKKLFGLLLIITGIRELLYKPKKKEHP